MRKLFSFFFSFSATERHFMGVLPEKFGKVVSAAFYVSKRNFWGKHVFLPEKNFVNGVWYWAKEIRLNGKIFGKVVKMHSRCLLDHFEENHRFWKCFFSHLRPLSEKKGPLSEKFGKVVKTAFCVSKGIFWAKYENMFCHENSSIEHFLGIIQKT